MTLTLDLDDRLVSQAEDSSGVQERSLLLTEAMKALIQRESARRLAELGGSQPDLQPVPRSRPL